MKLLKKKPKLWEQTLIPLQVLSSMADYLNNLAVYILMKLSKNVDSFLF